MLLVASQPDMHIDFDFVRQFFCVPDRVRMCEKSGAQK